MFRKLVNYFIPVTINNNPVELRLARIIVIVFLITGIFDLVGISSAIAIKFQYSAYLLFISSISSFMLAFLFKSGLSFRISATLFFSIGFIQIFLQAWYGGGLESPSSVALFLIPAIAMLLIGRKGATFWLILAVSAIFFMFWYEGNFGQLPEMYDINMRRNFELNGIIGMMLCIFVIILVIDSEKNEAYQKLFLTNKELKALNEKLETDLKRNHKPFPIPRSKTFDSKAFSKIMFPIVSSIIPKINFKEFIQILVDWTFRLD